jgi:hypothetical protein
MALARFGRKRRRSGAASGFSPLSLSPSLWLDAQAITPQANGSALASWSDLSGNANTASQTSVGDQPTYRTSAIGGKPAVRFNGVAANLLLVAQPLAGACTIFVALKYSGTPNSYQPILAVNDLYFLASLPAGSWGGFVGGNVSSGVTLDTTTTYILSFVVRNFNDIDCVTNGSLTNVMTGAAFIGATAEKNVGGSPNSGFSCAMDLGEMIVVDRAVTTLERINTEAYLAARW